MGFGRYRFRRSFGQVKAQFRGARPKFYPLFTGLLDTYAGAAAAYSLRRLSKIASSVVRVRRASDNAEKDFTADNITDGAMVNWVNGQIVPPLDIRELDANGERTGDLVEAAAAYSLRNLSESYTGNVVDVRRSSDDAEDSFTAAEVADGTLVAWVGAGNDGFVSQWYDQSGNDNHATQGTDASQPTIVDGGSLVLKGANSEPSIFFGTTADKHLDVTGRPIAQSVFSILQSGNNNFETLICDTVDSSPRITTNNAVNNRVYRFLGLGAPSVNVNGVTYNGTSSVFSLGFHLLGLTSGTGSEINRIGANPSTGATQNSFDFVSELILYPDNQSTNRTALEANIGETYGIDLPSGVDTGYDQVDGFVETWYDQSGNGNDAVQQVSGSQPKIVDGGVLVSGGIEFDGVNDRLTCSSLYSSDISIFNVVTTSNTVITSNYMRMIHLCDGSDSFQITRGGTTDIGKLISKNTAFQSGTTSFLHGDINGENLISAITSSTDTDAFVDGSLQSSSSASIVGSGNNATTTIGARDDLVSSTFFAGSHAELIIYASDQSDNRVAIETNINDHYDIYA